MKTSRSLSAFFGLLAILVSSPAKAEYPLISSTSVPGAVSGSLVNRLVQNPATGDLYAAGSLAAGAGNLNIWVARYSPALVLLSSFTYDKAGFNDAALGVAVSTLTSDVYVTGYVSSGAAQSSRDAWLARFDSTLVLQSSITVDGSASDRDEGTSLSVSSGAVYVVGISSQPGGKGIWLANYAANFVLISSGNYYQNNCEVSDFLRTAGGTFVVGGRAPNFLVSNDAWIGKFDANHVFLASAAYNGPASQTDHLHALAEDGSGGVFAVGFVYSATMADQYIAHFNSSLVRTASTTVNGPNNNNDSLTSVVRTSSGTLLVSGSYSAVAGLGGINLYLAEYDAALNKLSSTSYASSGSGADASYAVLVGANQDVYAAGYAANAGSQDMWLGRFSTSPASVSYPGCATTHNVGSGQTYATIQSAVDALPSILAGPSCVVIRDGATYAEQVTVRNFTNNGSSITILADPASGLRPVVAPPAASTAAFLIANASVNVQGIGAMISQSVPYGVWASSAYVGLSSVSVGVSTGGIGIYTAGVRVSSWSVIAYTSVTVGDAYGYWVEGAKGTTIRFSTAVNNSLLHAVFLENTHYSALTAIFASNNHASGHALYALGSDSNTVTQSYLWGGHTGADLSLSSDYNIISLSTMIGNAAYGLSGWSADANNVTQSYLQGEVDGAHVHTGSDRNTFSASSLIGRTAHGLFMSSVDSNTITQSYLWGGGGDGASLSGFAHRNTISLSTMIGGRGIYAALSDSNTVTQSYIQGGIGVSLSISRHNAFSLSTIVGGTYGASLQNGSDQNTIAQSTLTSSSFAFWVIGSSSNTLWNSYIQGSTAAVISGSTGTVVGGTEFVATAAAGTALAFADGSFGLTVATSTFRAPSAGRGLALNPGNAGVVTLAGVIISGAARGIEISTQGISFALAVDSVTFRALASGATAIHFLGGTFVSTFTRADFEDTNVGANVSGAALDPASRVTMRNSSGTRTGAAYENDPNSLVDWPIFVTAPSVPASLAASGVGLGAGTISWASGGNSTGTVYELERSSGTGFGLRQSSTAVSFVDAALSPASTYYYRVRALNAELAASAYTSTLAVVSLPIPVYPALASVAPSSAVTGASVFTAVVGSGFDASAALSLERTIAQGTWTATGSFAQGRFSSTLTKLRDGRVLLAGGMLEGSAAGLTAVDLYDPATGSWTAAAPLLQGRNQHVAALLADGRVLVTGGRTATANAINTAEIYDPGPDTWTTVAPMAQIRHGHEMATLPDGRVLAAGGTDGTIHQSSAEIYDPATGLWTAAASMSATRNWAASAVLADGRIMVSGGNTNTATNASAQIYDPQTNVWSAAGTMTVGRYNHRLAALPGGKVLASGGGNAAITDSADVYDPATNAWTATGAMAARRYVHAMPVVNGAAVVIGGQNETSHLATTEVYDAAANVWRPGPSLLGGRTMIMWAAALDDGRVLVAGGRQGLGGGTNLNTAELLGAATAAITATGVTAADAQHLSGTVDLTGAATGYWDVVVRESAGRVSRLSGGVLVSTGALPPASLAAAGVGLGAATISWASGGNSTGTVYELERSTGTGFGLRLSSTALSFLDLTLSPASTYYYRVRALDPMLVASAYTSTLAVVSPPIPVRPAIVSITPSAAATGASFPAAVVGTGFEAPAALSLERTPAGSGVWTATGSFTTARFGSALVKLRDGRALLIGGQLEGSAAGRPQVDLFNLSSGAWTAAAPLNVGRFELAAVMLADGRVLVTGGQAPDGSVGATAEIYDPGTGVWTFVAPMSQVRKAHRLALLPDGRVLAVGGAISAFTALLTAEIYDPVLNAWSAAPSMSALRAFPTLTVLGNGKVLVAGGRDPTAKSPSAQLYDPVANTWTETGPMSIGRSDHEALVLPDGRVLLAGGLDTVGESASGDVYDPVTSSWTATGPMAAQRRSLALALVDGEPLAIGGQSSLTDFASTDLYDAATNSWRAGPSLTGTRTLAAAVVLDDGKVLVAGGRRGLGGGTNLNTAERLDGPGASIAATGVSVPDAQHVNGTVSLAGAATGYWDVVVRDPAGRVGRLSGGVLVALPVAAPSGFAGSALSTSSILWSWADNSPNETGYRVMAGAVNVSGDLAAGATTWLQSGLGVNAPSGTLFARGFNAGGSADSAPAALYTLAAAPESLAATVFLTSAAVAWTSGNPAGTFFALERSTGGVFSLTASTTLASWVDTGLGAGTTYYYRVRAFNADAVATAYASSAAARTAVAAVPDAPSGFAGIAQSTTSVLWTWTDNSADEAGFRVKAGGTDLSGALPAGTTAWLQTGLGVNASAGAMFAQAFNSTGTADSGSLARYSLAAAPFGLASADVFETSATVSWTAGNPAGTLFELERSSGAGFVPAVSTAVASYTDTGLAEASTYTYRVRALNGDSVATAYASSIAFTTRPMPPPAAPAGFAGAAQSPVSILWSWTDAASTEAGYRVMSGAVGISSDLAAGSTAWLQAGLSTNTAYGPFAAQAFNPGGTVNSAAASRYTLAAAPAGGAAASITSTTLVASWSLAGNPPATIAALERSLDAVVYSTLAAGAVTSWADADLLGCTTYYYRVRNVNGDGVATAYASFSGVTANTIPGPPSGLSASANAGGTIGLSWGFSPTEGVTGYRLYWDAGSGTVSYAAPLAVLGSTASAFTTGVLTSSAAYTFALRAVHRCGVVETAGASAMSGAAIAAAEVRAAIKEPDSGRRVNGNRVTILGELIAGTPGDVQQVVFQYKLAASTGWIDVDEANVNHPNPDFSFPYFVHVDVTALAAGDYDLRAVAYNRDGVPDASPPAVRIVVDPVTPDVSETRLVDGTIKKDQTVSNAVTSVIDTAGAGAADPAVRVTIPVGAVNSTTATVSVIANPAITTAAPAGQSFVGSAIKIDLSNGQSALNGTAEITLTYPDTVLFPSLLQIYYLDEATGRWSRDFNSTVDTASRTVTGRTPHFSTFAIMLGTAFAPDLSSVRVYPVPFKPNGTNADEGRPFSIGDANSGIIFANMASGAEIRIYTLTGRLVASLDSPSIAGTVRWDARNQDGRDVASGAYFAVISAAGQKNVVKKLVIIR